jgi:hypothetical protein
VAGVWESAGVEGTHMGWRCLRPSELKLELKLKLELELELELKLIQTQMTQNPMLRAEAMATTCRSLSSIIMNSANDL